MTTKTRVPLMMEGAQLAAVDDARFQRRVESRAEMIRQLVQLGLETLKAKSARSS